jgi:HPt (histidine-containing phosphotransfer) domain-containing protein
MYNLKNIAEITSNNRKEINEFLELFCNESANAILKFQEGVSKNDITTIKFYAHKLKLSLKYLELNDLFDYCFEIENANEFLSFKSISEKVKILTLRLEQIIDEIRRKELIQE